MRAFIVPRNNARVCDGLLSNQRETTYADQKRATSRLIEPTKGDKRYVRRNAKGEFNKIVDVGKSLASDKTHDCQKESAESDRGRYEAVNRPVPSIPAAHNAAIAELLIREAETATGPRERALQRADHAAFMWPEEVRRCDANPDSGQAHKVLAKNPQWRARLRLQMHTEWSDGGGTISEMAAAAIVRGYKFIAITDHTKGLKIAGGLEIYVR